jgi:copper chaperone CopZ
MEHSSIHYISAISLLGMVGWAYIYPKLFRQNPQTIMETKNTLILKVEGMTCSHCSNHVVQALEKVPGVTSAKAEATQNIAWVDGKKLDLSALENAIKATGYEFKGPA